MARAGLVLILLAIALPARCVGRVVNVTLQAEAQVRPSHIVTVGDVASVQGPPTLTLKARQVSIGSAPPPGERKSLALDYVKLRLDAAGLRGCVKVAGPKAIQIVGKCRRWSSESIAEAARKFVEGALHRSSPPDFFLGGTVRTYEVSVERPPRAMVTPPGQSAELRPRLLGATVRNGINGVLLEAVVDGRVASTSSAAVRVKEVAEVLTALEAIRQKEPLTDRNTAWAKREVSHMTSPIRAGDVDSSALVARRTIRAGAIITVADVTSPPVVRKGDVVSVVVMCGAVRLVTTAEAKQDGNRGETIAIRPAVSARDVRGRLIEPGLVELTP